MVARLVGGSTAVGRREVFCDDASRIEIKRDAVRMCQGGSRVGGCALLAPHALLRKGIATNRLFRGYNVIIEISILT